MERKGTDDFLLDVADEEPDAAAFAAAIVHDEETQWPAWAGIYRTAFMALRDDRFYGAMGGAGRIHFSAIDRYARRYRIVGDAFDQLKFFLGVLDEEYLAYLDEKAKEAEARSKSTQVQ